MSARYGSPDVVRVEEVSTPDPGPGEVLVQVRWSTVTRTDCGYRVADPFFIRAFTGLRRPRTTILLGEFQSWLRSGEFRPVLDDKRFDLDQIVAEYTYLESEQKIGNVLLRVGA